MRLPSMSQSAIPTSYAKTDKELRYLCMSWVLLLAREMDSI